MEREIFSNLKMVLVSPPRNFLSNPLLAEPLGLMYLEGVLQNLGVDVQMVDMSFDKQLPKADVYGFSSSTVDFPQVVEYAKSVKPALTIIGGPHSSALPNEALEIFDAVVVGPGERVIGNILSAFQENLPRKVWKGSNEDIDLIPLPPRPILERISYGIEGRRIATIISSRGCPYNCSFCASRCVWGRRVEYRSIENIIREIQYLVRRFDIRDYKFVDDILCLNKQRFMELSDCLSKLDISWTCEVRVDSLDEEILDAMIAGGCSSIDLGIESVDDLVLQRMKKKQSVQKAREAIQFVKSKGLKAKIYLIYGLPFEPKDIVEKTISFIEETEPDQVSLFTLVPYPGTDLWNHPERYGIKKIEKDFSLYQHSVGGKEEELDWLSNLEYHDRTREELRENRNRLKFFAMKWNRRN